MKKALIHFGPIYVHLIITESATPSMPLLHRTVALHLLQREHRRNLDDSNDSVKVEKVLNEFLAIIEKYQAQSPQITFSADLADAEILVFLRLFLRKLGLPPIEIRDFLTEFESMRYQLKDLSSESLVVQVSEAHLRFIKIRENQPEFIFNLPCGIILLTNDFLKNDPPEPAEIIALRDHLSAEFDRLQWYRLPKQILTFSDTGMALASLINDSSDGDNIKTVCITKDQLQKILPDLTHNYKNQIARHPGANPDFSDYYLATALVYEHLLDYFHLEQVINYGQAVADQ
ncbi:MAG: hypothetical protein M0R44_04685 [Candidatus Marinimicrobia bacterium]|jgi:hypothetical protein|nr:hypothetical protein [Candidatus Neomarinimicrobiota bacterium]